MTKITAQEIETLTKYKHYEMIALLKAILTESGTECEYDKEIHKVLSHLGELEDYTPYWID